MADNNNVIKFRRVEKKPEKKPEPSRRTTPTGPRLSSGRLSVVAWAAIVVAAVAIFLVQQSGLFGG